MQVLRSFHIALVVTFASSLVVLQLGCGGSSSSGSGTITGLSVAEQVSVVTPQEESGGAQLEAIAYGVADFASDAQYRTDDVDTWVYDSSMEAVNIVNEILCYMSQAGYAEMVNLGDYSAQVDEASCRQGSDQSSESSDRGQSSAGDAEQPALWVIQSARATPTSDQIVQLWVPQTGDNGPGGQSGFIHVRTVISESVSDENPFGSFVMNFAGVAEGGSVSYPYFLGTLGTQDPSVGLGFTFFERQGDVSVAPDPGTDVNRIQASILMSSDQTTGAAIIDQAYRENYGGDSGLQEQTHRIAFDETHLLRQTDGGQAVCLSRTNFTTRIWRYNLYYSTGANAGARVTRTSGFPIRTADGDYGWVGYWGLWVPDGVTVAHGDTVTRDDWGSSDETPYTVVRSGGRLIRNTRVQLALTEIQGEMLQWWEFAGEGQEPTNYRVRWTGTEFEKVATRNHGTNKWDDMQAPEAIVVEAGAWMGMWSDSLGGQVNWIGGENTVTLYRETNVNGGDALFAGGSEVALYGYWDCLRSGITAEQVNAGEVYRDAVGDVQNPYAYVFRRADLSLYDETETAVGLASGVTPSSGPFTWGMRSGPLVADTSALTSAGDIFDLDEYYTYETGHNNWNRQTSLVDGEGAFVSFDPPIHFTYTHTQANDVNDDDTWAGQLFVLEYHGPGDLHGIPHEGVDFDGDTNEDRWYPVFGMRDGTTLTDSNGVEYVVKAVEKEQVLTVVGAGECAGLELPADGELTLPTEDGYTTPDIGTRPTVTDPPAVIEGEVQS